MELLGYISSTSMTTSGLTECEVIVLPLLVAVYLGHGSQWTRSKERVCEEVFPSVRMCQSS